MARQMRKWWMSWKVLALAAAGGLAYFIFRGLGLSQGPAEAGAGVDHQAGAPAVPGRSVLEQSREWAVFKEKLADFFSELKHREEASFLGTLLIFSDEKLDLEEFQRKKSVLLKLLEQFSASNLVSEAEQIVLEDYIREIREKIKATMSRYQPYYLGTYDEHDMAFLSENDIIGFNQHETNFHHLNERLALAIENFKKDQDKPAAELIGYRATTAFFDNCANSWNKEIQRLSDVVQVDPATHRQLAEAFADEETGRLYLQFQQLYQEQSRRVLAEMKQIRPEILELICLE